MAFVMHPVIACFDIMWGMFQAGIGAFVFAESMAMWSHHGRPRWAWFVVVGALLIVATSPLLYYVDGLRHTGIEAKP